MDLAKQAKIVDGIHDTLNDFVGQRLKVRANMGRSKIVESEGTLMQVHPQLFIMEVDRKRGRTARQSYQYVDVLTGMVDFDAERTRLAKEQKKLAGDAAKFSKKLSNPGFLAKAAPEIVEKDRAKLAEIEDQLARVEAQLAELG